MITDVVIRFKESIFNKYLKVNKKLKFINSQIKTIYWELDDVKFRRNEIKDFSFYSELKESLGDKNLKKLRLQVFISFNRHRCKSLVYFLVSSEAKAKNLFIFQKKKLFVSCH